MDERISFVTHQGKSIMVVDFSGCTVKQMLPLLDQVQHAVARHERNSLLTLADMTNAHVDRDVAMRIKEVLTLDRPFVKRSAWVGASTLPKVYLDNFKSFSQRDFPSFATRAEAMDWLVKQEP
jgi:hypothetical protein